MTPRLILQHLSGLPNWGSFALAEIREPAQFEINPGERFGYSGEAYTALQAFVESRTDQKLEELFVTLAKEAGMSNSSFINHEVKTDQYANAQKKDGGERDIFLFKTAGSAYSLVSTAEDLARFIAFYFRKGNLSRKVFEESIRPGVAVEPDAWGASIPVGATINWTLAWGLQEIKGKRLFFHGGNNGEFRSFFAYSPSRETGVAVMTNSASGLSFISEIFEPLLGSIKPAAVWWGYEVDKESNLTKTEF